MIMKKNYRKPRVAVIKLRMELLLNGMSVTEEPEYTKTDLPANSDVTGHGNGFWQAPGVEGIIDDEE